MERSIGKRAQERGWGYMADRTPSGQAMAVLVTRDEDGIWRRSLDSGSTFTRVAVQDDDAIYDEPTWARQEARARWRLNPPTS